MNAAEIAARSARGTDAQNAIRPDRSDESRCISVHWSLPVQCVLPVGHRENWHEAWHPESGNRLRFRRSMGGYRTEDLHHGEWHDLQLPPPGGFCGLLRSNRQGVRCTEQYGHGWVHRAKVDGVQHTWNTLPAPSLNVDQLTRDVKQLRGMVVAAHARIAELETERGQWRDTAHRLAGEAGLIPREGGAGRVVAYRVGDSGSLYCCILCCRGSGRLVSLTSEDLPDGGVCAACGTDVLIPQPKSGGAS